MKFKIAEERSIKDALKSNRVLKAPFKPHPNIDIFNKNLDNTNFMQNTTDCLTGKYTTGVVGFWYIPNRGAILTNYALNEVINELGYNCKTINYIPDNFISIYKGSIAEQFAKKYLNLTRDITTPEELKTLNNEIGTFVCGSDQIWRYLFRKKPFGYMFLNFVDNKNKMISYSTSFGTVKYDGPEQSRTYMRHYLNKFDAISVREHQAVKILKEDFNIEGTQIIDPVFLIDKSKYENLINNSTKQDKNFIAYYFIRNNKGKEQLLKKVQEKYKIKTIDIAGNNNVEDWLYYIKNCEILITDSFHGTCFATIFNKKFIATNPVNERPTRFETILNVTKMMDRFLYNPLEIDKKEYLFDDIDWAEANKNLENEIFRGKKWLQEALNKPRKELTEEQKLADYLLNKENETQIRLYSTLKIIHNRNKIHFKYYTAKLLYNISFGKIKQKAKYIKDELKPMIRQLRELKGSF